CSLPCRLGPDGGTNKEAPMTPESNEYLANCLRELRARRAWTQEELGKIVGVTRQTIIAIEKGEYNPSAMLALTIAQAFGLPVEEVFWLTTVKPIEEKQAESKIRLSLTSAKPQSSPSS